MLFDFLKKLPSLNEINGSYGEWLTKIFSKTMTDAYVLHDILIDGSNGYTSQTDLILICGTGIYVVEVKTFTDAKIYGDVNKSKWYYYKSGKKYDIYSPIYQNKKHIEHLKKLLSVFGEVPFFSVITMICEDFKISGESDGKTLVCNSLPAMERGIKKLSENKPIVMDDETKKKIYEYIQNNQYAGKEARAEHKQNVSAFKAEIEKSEQQKICPYCKIPLVIRNGKHGEFYGCKNFPKCRYTLNK